MAKKPARSGVTPLASKTKRKALGRPRDDAHRIALIDGTMRLLQTTPPSELSLRDIARAASVDPALIRYYFGDKYHLYAEVIALIAAEFERLGGAALEGKGTPKQRLGRFIRANHEAHARHPHYHQLVLDQITHGRPEPVRTIRSNIGRSLRKGLLDVMRDGEKAGELRVVDPGYLGIVIIGMCEFFCSGWGPVATILGESTAASLKTSSQTYGEFMEDIILRALAP